MFQDTYRRMQSRIEPPYGLVEKTLARTEKKPERSRGRRTVPRVAAILAAAACLLATPVLAVRTETGYDLIYMLSPETAQHFKPVQMSCTDNGVTMEVLAVRLEDSRAQAYIALSGDKVDETCDLFDSYSFHLPFDQESHCEYVQYDPDSHSAVFLCTTETMDGSPIPEGRKLTFSAGCFLSGKQEAEDLAVDFDLPAYPGEAAIQTDGYYGSNGAPVPMLQPQGTLAQPVEGISVTAAGYADGYYHVQVCLGIIQRTDNHCSLWLEDAAGNRLDPTYGAYFQKESGSMENDSYEDFVFDLPAEKLSEYTLHGYFSSAAELTEGKWQVTFPLENTNAEAIQGKSEE